MFSKEHVIPYSLGGSNELTIDVCQDANSTLGHTVDAALINHPLMTIQRVLYDLRSADGAVPKWTVKSAGEVGGRTVQLIYSVMPGDPQLNTSLRSAPIVQRQDHHDGTSYSVQASPADFERIITDINRKRQRRGEALLDSADLLKHAIEIRETPELLMTLDGDPEQFERAYIKIALGMGHFAFGESFSRGDGAERLRKALWAPDRAGRLAVGLHGSVWPNLAENAQQLGTVFGTPESHTGLVPNFETRV